MKHFIVLFILFFHFFATAQKASYSSFSTIDGLTQSQVVGIVQDNQGYLWLGTYGGLSRFNGGKFSNYTSTNGLYDNHVVSLQLINGEIYAGHIGGISYFNQGVVKSISLPTYARQHPVTCIIEYNGRILVATNGGGLLELKNGVFQKINTRRNMEFIRDLKIHKNKLCIATYEQVWVTEDLFLYDSLVMIPDGNIISLFPSLNELLIGTYMNGLFSYIWSESRLVEIENTLRLSIKQFAQAKSGVILIATSGGLLEYRNRTIKLKSVENGLPINNISSIRIDRNDNVWIGSQGKGVLLAPNENITFYDGQSGLPSDLIISAFQMKNGTYVLGTTDAALHFTKDFHNFSSKAIDIPAWVILNDVDGRFWFSSMDGIKGEDQEGNSVEYTYRNGLAFGKVRHLHKIDHNQMYITSEAGVVLYNKGRCYPLTDSEHSIDVLTCAYPFKGVLLVGTEKGMYYVKDKKYTYVPGIQSKVNSFQQIDDGRLFVGTEEGIYLFDGVNVERINFSPFSSTNFINFLIAKNNDLIAGTNNGVVVLRFKGNKFTVTRLTRNNGLIDPETNAGTAFFDKNDILWFGTPSGFVRVDYESFVANNEHVSLLFKDVRLNYKPFDIAKYHGRYIDGKIVGLVFPHDKNNLQFDFDIIALKDYENISFQYKLEGLETEWSPNTSALTVTYSNLQPRDYILKARLVNEEGVVLDEFSMSFIIRPAYYKTWWFICLVSMSLVSLTLIFVRVRIQREKMQAELEKAEMRTRLVQLEQQSLNASMNRHFIFNSLNSIQYFINISDKLSANKYLSNFAKLIRKNLDTSSEDDNMISLDQEIERLRLYLSLESMRFNGAFTYEIISTVNDLEDIRIPAMMVQPFVENSIIHGVLPRNDKNGRIIVEVKDDKGDLIISVLDNGIGIDESFKKKQKTNGDHTSRGMDITMKRIDLIRKISDQRLFISGPYQLFSKNGESIGTEVQIKIVQIGRIK